MSELIFRAIGTAPITRKRAVRLIRNAYGRKLSVNMRRIISNAEANARAMEAIGAAAGGAVGYGTGGQGKGKKYMNFQPKTEQEIQDAKLWKKGEYDFEIADAAEKQSKAGKTMIELRLRISDGKNARTISDYLLPETPEKLRHAASACGLLDKYDHGALADGDLKGKRGRLMLGIEKDRKKIYPDKNVVQDYVCAETAKKGSGGSAGHFGLKF
jgi:hypothetical protein